MLGYERLLFIERITVKIHKKVFPVASFILLTTEITRSLLYAYHLDIGGTDDPRFKVLQSIPVLLFSNKNFASFLHIARKENVHRTPGRMERKT